MVKNPKKISLFYGHIASNLGDMAINTGVQALVNKAFPDSVLTVVLYGADGNKYYDLMESSFTGSNMLLCNFKRENSNSIEYIVAPSRFLMECLSNEADLV